MPVERIGYAELPSRVRDAVAEVTSLPTKVEPVIDGLNSSVAAKPHTADGTYFVRALLCSHRWAWTQAKEAEIAPHVHGVAPTLHARMQEFADPADLHHFAGSALLHTDLNNANVIVGEAEANVVDWGWATCGAVWLDAAYWVIWLISAGHGPE